MTEFETATLAYQNATLAYQAAAVSYQYAELWISGGVGATQCLLIGFGLWFMHRSAKRRDMQHTETMAVYAERHAEVMAADSKRHEEVMAAMAQRHEEVMAALSQHQ